MTPAPLRPRALPRRSAGLCGIEAGREGFMKRNMQLDFVNRSPTGRQFNVVAKRFGPIRVARVLGTPSRFTRARRHLADGRDLVSVVISGGGRFRVEGVRGNDRYTG